MYNIIFYEDKNGHSEIAEWLYQLKKEADEKKDSRIKYIKIIAYINILQQKGTRSGIPFSKHLEGDIWELRPLKNRILYAYYKDDTYILLHHFTKETRKTPHNELSQAKRNLKNFLEREGI